METQLSDVCPQLSSWESLISSGSCSVFIQQLNLVYPNMKTTNFQTKFSKVEIYPADCETFGNLLADMCILMEKLDCTGHSHQVCVCWFSCLEYASGLETSLNVSGVSISFTWTPSHILDRDKPVFTVSTKCFPGDDHTSNMPDHEKIQC